MLVEKAKFTKIKPTIESMFKGIYGSDRKPTNTEYIPFSPLRLW